jgi:hypothetical protein
VENINKIKFSFSPFDILYIPEAKKKVIKSVAKSRLSAEKKISFDDVIAGKGSGVNILLQ